VSNFSVRRVVTGHRGGSAAFLEDGVPPNTVAAPNGLGVTELLWLDGHPADSTAGIDRTDGGFPLEPPAGGLSSRIIRMPAPDPSTPVEETWLRVHGDDDAHPGMHVTDTLDLMLVLDGGIVLGVDDGEVRLRAGDAVIQRRTRHRWRVVGDEPCTYWVTMLRPDPASPEVPGAWRSEAGSGIRRVVTDGSSARETEAPVGLAGGSARIIDLWQTLGPPTTGTQGGDPDGPWALEPLGGGTSFRILELGPGDMGDAAWHTTTTIDIDVILAGRVGLDLPDVEPVELGRGDVVIQRGTHHRWRVLGDEPLRMATVMVAVPAI
jgi:mannose-6-phosphate isomerase-like protein (cupin superfamily)